MIDQQRNQRFWKACGWKWQKESGCWHWGHGFALTLPSPSDPVSFTGHLLRDGLPKVREKLGSITLGIYIDDKGLETINLIYKDPKDSPDWLRRDFVTKAPTLSEAMFNAFEKALGLEEK